MATRNNLSHASKTREKIQTTMLIKRLMQHALEDLDLSASQVKAIEILLRKTLPDLKQVEITGEDGGAIKTDNLFRIEVISADADNQDS